MSVVDQVLRRNLPRWFRGGLMVSAVVGLAWFAGSSVAAEGPLRTAVLGGAAVALAGPVIWAISRPHAGPRFISVEVPVLLLLLSTLVWRIRDAESLATDPLDSAGLYRVLCVGLAGLLGALALTDPVPNTERITTRPYRLYVLYVLVVFAGAPVSVDAPLTAYRGVELATGLIVLAGAYRVAGPSAMRRVEHLIYLWSVASLIVVWIGVAVAPSQGLIHLERSPLPWQIRGVFPSVSANGVGTLAVLVAIWSFALLVGRERESLPLRPRLLATLVIVGLVSLVFAQYRTGYVAAAVGLVAVLALRSRPAVAWVAVALILIASFLGPSFIGDVEPVLLRGQTPEEASQLSSRVFLWKDALLIWEESPLIGRGLLTGTRFEVLAALGRTETSSIHGTWIEALVGTGIIGTLLLVAAFLTLFARAIAEAVYRRGRILPAAILTTLLIRSATGSTIEVFGPPVLLILAFALSLRDPVRPAKRALSDEARLAHPTGSAP